MADSAPVEGGPAALEAIGTPNRQRIRCASHGRCIGGRGPGRRPAMQALLREGVAPRPRPPEEARAAGTAESGHPDHRGDKQRHPPAGDSDLARTLGKQAERADHDRQAGKDEDPHGPSSRAQAAPRHRVALIVVQGARAIVRFQGATVGTMAPIVHETMPQVSPFENAAGIFVLTDECTNIRTHPTDHRKTPCRLPGRSQGTSTLRREGRRSAA